MSKIRILVLLNFLIGTLTAQEQKSNLQTFTPSALFSPGEYELNLYNSLYSQNSIRDSERNRVDLGESQGFLNHQFQYTTAIKQLPKINIGLEVNITTAKYSNDDNTSPLAFFTTDKTFSETVVSSIGPRVKFNLSKKIPKLSVQSTFLIPIADSLQDRRFIAWDRYTWFTQFFYDKNLSDKVQLFLEVDFLYRIKTEKSQGPNFFRLPLSAFLSYFPNSKTIAFVFTQHSPRFGTSQENFGDNFTPTNWFTQLGVGGKYQINRKLAVEVAYAKFIASKLDGAGYSLNFGLRYINR